jgi:CheY-like chemotaxis protein
MRLVDDTSGHRVLLVDDDAMIRMLAGESLRHAGFAGQRSGLRRAGRTSFRGTGIRPVRARRDDARHRRLHRSASASASTRGQWLPIVMLTGLNDSESIELAYRSGATDFITKPINWLLLTSGYVMVCAPAVPLPEP